jgi:hypothetical protein
MDYVLLTYAIIFGILLLYLLTLWYRLRQSAAETKRYKRY